jgi:hypothetical protein
VLPKSLAIALLRCSGWSDSFQPLQIRPERLWDPDFQLHWPPMILADPCYMIGQGMSHLFPGAYE